MKICFVNGTNPNFLGGIGLYQKNLIKILNKKKFEITWIYKGRKNQFYKKDQVNYMEIKVPKLYFWNDFIFNKKVKKILRVKNFGIINSHAIWGYWMKNYKRKGYQKIIHTYHGVTMPYYKIQLKRFNFFARFFMSTLLLPFGYFIEKPPVKKADKIICVSNKVKKQLIDLYGKRKNIFILRTGVDLKYFKLRNKKKVRKEFGLNNKKIYGLYVGRGGYWTKGFDRVIKLSEEIYKKNKKYELLVIGPNREKVKYLINKKFVNFLKDIPREKIPFYYSASDFLFCFSRYEGGAPTLVVSEAMASGCLLVCSKDSEQEILQNEKNSIIIDNFDKKDANKILNILGDKKLKKRIIKDSLDTIKNISLGDWGKKYLKVLFE